MKYMGSKARISKHILPIILRDRKPDQWYVEPFAGGMNMICEVKGNRIANDAHVPLIIMWEEILNGWIPIKFTRDEYRHIIQNKKMYPPSVVAWVGFNCSFSGRYFAGFAGETKTETGVIRDYQDEAIRNVLKQVPKLQGIILESVDYRVLPIPERSIIYCDPPYNGSSGYITGEFDHVNFWKWCRDKVRDEHKVFISEYKAPDDFVCVWEKEVSSSLSANGVCRKSKPSIEKLFIHIAQEF